MHAQQPDSLDMVEIQTSMDSLLFVADSIGSDTIVNDTIPEPLPSEAAISSEVDYSATDSLVFSLDGGTVQLYGDARITFDDIELVNYEHDAFIKFPIAV